MDSTEISATFQRIISTLDMHMLLTRMAGVSEPLGPSEEGGPRWEWET